MKTVSILGATGSVGRSTADIILANPDRFAVQAVTANSNAAALADLAIALKAKLAVVADNAAYKTLADRLQGKGIETAAGPEGMVKAAMLDADYTMAAIVGMAGLRPLIKALERGRTVAIANKEPLVAAGALVLSAAKHYGATLLPIDSEHNAVFQLFDPAQRAAVEKIILTASGGPFRTMDASKMRSVTPEQAVLHPNWSMGAKISVDSATMMNKALEIIEAHVLFDMPPSKIDVLIHPQSIVHAMVEYSDGSVLAHLGAPDMRTPIAHTLAWPDRMATPGRKLDWATLSRLEFSPPDHQRFPAIRLAYRCLESGPAACIAMNAANEIAVAAFLARRLSFPAIVETVTALVDEAGDAVPKTLEEIVEFDQTVRDRTTQLIASRKAA